MSNGSGDSLKSLPTDQSEPSFREKSMVDALYPEEKIVTIEKAVEVLPTASRKIWHSFREIATGSILFAVLSLPEVDALVKKWFRTENAYYTLVLKTALFAVLFFVLTHYSLARASP